jgi:TRAP-type C4-dicarboxylate transport system permease small subunit
MKKAVLSISFFYLIVFSFELTAKSLLPAGAFDGVHQSVFSSMMKVFGPIVFSMLVASLIAQFTTKSKDSFEVVFRVSCALLIIFSLSIVHSFGS